MNNQTEGHTAPTVRHAADAEALRVLDWRQRVVRSTPLLLWGWGDIGHSVAHGFMEALAACFPNAGPIQLFQPQDDPLSGWHEWLAQWAEQNAAQHTSGVLEVAIIFAAWQFDARQQELMQHCERSLVALPSVKATLTPVALLPGKAGAADQQRLEVCFQALEQWAPATSCVNPILLCRTTAQPPAHDAGVLEQLFRALVDALCPNFFTTPVGLPVGASVTALWGYASWPLCRKRCSSICKRACSTTCTGADWSISTTSPRL